MLSDLPVVRRETLEAQKAQLRWQNGEELRRYLDRLAERNPLLVERLLKAAGACLDTEAAPELLCIPEETMALVRDTIIQGMLLLLDLVDRELFAAKQESLMAR